MTTSEKVAYLKGLAEGMGIDETTKEGKLCKVIIDVLEDLALDLADTKDTIVDLTDTLEEVDEDLAELEDEFYECACSCCGEDDEDEEDDEDDEDEDDEDEDDEDYEDPVYYAVKCPGCDLTLTVGDSVLDMGTFECPACGETIDFEIAEMEEVELDD